MAGHDGKKKEKDGESSGGEKLDIATTLHTMTQTLTLLQGEMTGVNQAIEAFNTRLDNTLSELSTSVTNNVKDHFNPQLEEIKDNVNALTERVDTILQDIDRRLQHVKAGLDTLIKNQPVELFNPDLSVIMFGVPYKKGEDITKIVTDLFKDTLKVGVTIKNIERSGARDGKPFAVKVELDSIYEKKQVLRAKKNCNASKATSMIRIKGCESHSDRVNRMNCTYILKMLGKGDDHFVVGNGLIKSKAEIKAAGPKGGSTAPVVVEKSELKKPKKAATNGPGDNGEHVQPVATCSSQNNNKNPNDQRSVTSDAEDSSDDDEDDPTEYELASTGSDAESETAEPPKKSAPKPRTSKTSMAATPTAKPNNAETGTAEKSKKTPKAPKADAKDAKEDGKKAQKKKKKSKKDNEDEDA